MSEDGQKSQGELLTQYMQAVEILPPALAEKMTALGVQTSAVDVLDWKRGRKPVFLERGTDGKVAIKQVLGLDGNAMYELNQARNTVIAGLATQHSVQEAVEGEVMASEPSQNGAASNGHGHSRAREIIDAHQAAKAEEALTASNGGANPVGQEKQLTKREVSDLIDASVMALKALLAKADLSNKELERKRATMGESYVPSHANLGDIENRLKGEIPKEKWRAMARGAARIRPDEADAIIEAVTSVGTLEGFAAAREAFKSSVERAQLAWDDREAGKERDRSKVLGDLHERKRSKGLFSRFRGNAEEGHDR